MAEPKPFRVGIVGLSPVGRFLLERLSLLTGCESAIFQPSNESSDQEAQSLGIATIPDWPRFLYESELSAVLFLDGERLSLELVEQAFRAGLVVGFLPPLAIRAKEWQEVVKNPDRRWFLLNPHFENPDFRSAMRCIQSGEMGPIAGIERVSWVGDLVTPETLRPPVPDRWLSQLLWEDVDQLLRIAGERPASVYAAEFNEQPASYLLIFRFRSGAVAHLERRRGSAVPLEVGWTITGPEGGYANGHRHIRTEHGELYDVPVELPEGDPLSIFDPLRMPDSPMGDESTARQVAAVLNVLTAIAESARTGGVIRLEVRS